MYEHVRLFFEIARTRVHFHLEHADVSRRDERLVTTLQGTASKEPARRDSENDMCVCVWGGEGGREGEV